MTMDELSLVHFFSFLKKVIDLLEYRSYQKNENHNIEQLVRRILIRKSKTIHCKV